MNDKRQVPAQTEPTSLWKGCSEVSDEYIKMSGNRAKKNKAEDRRVLVAELVTGPTCCRPPHPFRPLPRVKPGLSRSQISGSAIVQMAPFLLTPLSGAELSVSHILSSAVPQQRPAAARSPFSASSRMRYLSAASDICGSFSVPRSVWVLVCPNPSTAPTCSCPDVS